MSSITDRVLEAKAKIAAAAAEAGRSPSEIRLLAATKMNGPDAVREAVAAGVDLCGENRAQEFIEKNAAGAYGACPVHFIGHLQRNKIKYLVGAVALIQSVDSIDLLRAVDRRAAALGLVQDVLLEVNIGGELSKSGVAPEDLPLLLAAAAETPNAHVAGLMTIPPADVPAEQTRGYFLRMKELFVDIRSKKYDNVSMNELSMGMSGDFEDAVRCGSTIVRLGTALFGPRNYDI